MKDICSIASSPAPTAGISLQAVWDVDADASYDVHGPWKNRDHYIAVRTLQGAGEISFLSGDLVEVLPNSLLMYHRRDLLRYRCHRDRWRFLWFEFTAPNPHNLPLHTLITVPPQPADPADLQQILSGLRRDRTSQRVFASALFSTMLYRWLARWEDSAVDLPHRGMVESIIDSMPERFETGWTVSDMARQARMSERAFRNAFLAVTGESPKACFDRLRMHTAEELLRLGTFTVSQVAYRLGFSSPFHFSKAFKQRFSRPPSSLLPRHPGTSE